MFYSINSMKISLYHVMTKDDLSPQRFPGSQIESVSTNPILIILIML